MRAMREVAIDRSLMPALIWSCTMAWVATKTAVISDENEISVRSKYAVRSMFHERDFLMSSGTDVRAKTSFIAAAATKAAGVRIELKKLTPSELKLFKTAVAAGVAASSNAGWVLKTTMESVLSADRVGED